MNSITDNDAELFKAFIDNHDFFFICGHKEPDGDCISSCLCAAAILDFFKKPYQLLSAGPFKRAEVRDYENKFSSIMEFQTQDERNRTGLIITDCSELSRLGEIDGDLKGFDTFIIDHHKTSETPENAQSYIDSQSPACSILLQQFYEKLAGPLPKELAELVFFGFCTDTGYFRFLDNTQVAALASATRLVEYGANPRETYKKINSGRPYSTRKLLGVLLSKAERYLDGKLVITFESLNDTKQYGLEGRDSDSLYQLLLSSEGVEDVVFLRQETETTCTGGFRSQDKIDVSLVASKFGGGGHKNASGMSCEGRIENLIPQIVKEFARII